MRSELLAGRRLLVGAVLSACAPSILAAQQVDVRDTLHIRLLDRVRSHHFARPSVRAVVIAPVADSDGRVVIPPGALLSGHVTGSGVEHYAGKRHWLDVRFDSIAVPMDDATHDTLRAAFALRLAAVDDSRETIDSAGRIVGPAIPSIVRSRSEWVAALLGIFHPITAIVLAATFEGERRERHRAISLNAGFELCAVAQSTQTLAMWTQWKPPPPIPSDVNADSIAATTPLRASLRFHSTPSDVVDIALIGSDAQVRAALSAAGWTRAAPNSLKGDVLTFAKAAKGEGYDAQPVSTLLLGSRAPDAVYEKVADTFVKRHHFRVWRWPEIAASDSASVWLVAATHDTGVMFSEQSHSFTHSVDPHIDGERDKVVTDLVAADRVAALSYVERQPPSGRASLNDRRTPVYTDWRMAVVVLK